MLCKCGHKKSEHFQNEATQHCLKCGCLGYRPETRVIFEKDGLYLSAMYKWAVIPHLFHEWQFPALLDLFEKWTDKPTRFAEVTGKSIDLDRLDWVML